MNDDSQTEAVVERIKDLLISQLQVAPAAVANADSHTLLLGRGVGLDSLEVMALVAAIETEFDIEVDDEDLTVELVKDLRSLAEYVEQKALDQQAEKTRRGPP